jgi:putative transcriptional regulator
MFKKKIRIENAVRKLRFNNGEMTQQQLAELVGVSRQTVVAIEKYKYTPSLDLAFKIALAFDMEIQEVFFINQYFLSGGSNGNIRNGSKNKRYSRGVIEA